MSQTLKNITMSGGKSKKITKSKKVMKLKKSKLRKVNSKRTKKKVRRNKKIVKGGETGISEAIPIYEPEETVAHKIATYTGVNENSCAKMTDEQYANLTKTEKAECAGRWMGRRLGDVARKAVNTPGTVLKGTAALIGNAGKAMYNVTRRDKSEMYRPDEHFQYLDTFNEVDRSD